MRVLTLESAAELRNVNRELGEEPQRCLTVAALASGAAPIPPQDAANIDLVLAEGAPEDESAGNLPLVVVPNLAGALKDLEAALEARAHTAAVLARLLRTTADLPLEAALEIESLAYGTLLGGAEFADWLARRGSAGSQTPGPDPVLLQRDRDSLTITLNDPKRHNAYSAHMRDALLEALAVPLLDDSITSVELRGAGKSLCSGADLGEFGQSRDLPAAHLLRTRQHVGRALANLGGKVHVRAHGACIGAGIEIPAFAARITAAPGAFFRLPELSMGLIPGAGGTVSIPRRIGRWRTLYMVLSGVDIRAARAVRWGLADTLEQ